MNKNLFRILPIILTIVLITGCILHNNIFYTPDIALKKDGQPCISIPANEDFFRRKKEFDISYLYVFQAGVGELWSKNNLSSKKNYYIKNQQCLYFNYRFQANI
ncbi:putative T6SS immunity periplasmic lipoprotein, partial [Snodgrassella sp. CS2]|uniref:putative T6SS immunity periplasmic lipoprotein n=1 Tax=Snodgrassella sp. CS2 TaxID=3418953 RepID=UPI003CFFABCA